MGFQTSSLRNLWKRHSSKQIGTWRMRLVLFYVELKEIKLSIQAAQDVFKVKSKLARETGRMDTAVT